MNRISIIAYFEFSYGYGSLNFTSTGSCSLNSSGDAYVWLDVKNGTIFSPVVTPFGTAKKAGYICEKESKYYYLTSICSDRVAKDTGLRL